MSATETETPVHPAVGRVVMTAEVAARYPEARNDARWVRDWTLTDDGWAAHVEVWYPGWPDPKPTETVVLAPGEWELPEPSPTAVAIARALVESTGAHFLDSGGAYGRQWERNQSEVAGAARRPVSELSDAELVAYFESRPEVDLERCEPYPLLDVFHFLSERLELATEADAAFREWATTGDRSDESWLACASGWPEHLGVRGSTGYTYNYENALSQDVHYTVYEHEDETYAVVSIHNGCDARSGFTTPRVFLDSSGFDGMAGFLFQASDWDVWCPGRPRPQAETLVAVADGYYDSHSQRGEEIEGDLEVLDAKSLRVRCPECGGDQAVVQGPVADG